MVWLRLLEELRGVGTLRRSDTGLAIRVGYQVMIFQEMLDLPAGRPPVEGLRRIEASVNFEGDLYEWVGAEATLQLKDGRCLDGFISNDRGAFAVGGRGLYSCS